MAWIYLAESLETPLGSEATSKQLPTVKTTNTLSLSFYHECIQKTSNQHPSGMTSVLCQNTNLMLKSISSSVDFPVKTFLMQENKQELQQKPDPDCSFKLSDSLKSLNQDIYFLKMLLPYEGTVWTSCAKNLPKSGMICDGLLYPLEKLAQNTKETDGLCSPFGEVKNVPTPTVMDYMNPRSPEAMKRMYQGMRKGRNAPCNLREWIHPEMWPTPCSRDYKGGNRPEIVIAKGRNPLTNNLPDAVMFFPTPTKEDYRRRGPSSKQQGLPEKVHTGVGQLNPDWVEWLMGFPVGWTVVNTDIYNQINKKKIKNVVSKCLNFLLSSEYWDNEPDIDRTTPITEQRVERIKRLGNSVVPLQAKVAFEMLLMPVCS